MPCHPHTARRHLWPSIGISLSLYNLDNHRQRRPSPYGHPEDLSRPFEDLRGSPTTFEDPRRPSRTFEEDRRSFDPPRSPSRSFDPPRSPSRSFDPLSIPFGGPRAYIAPSLRPRTIPQYPGHRPLARRFPLAGFRTLFGCSVMLVGAVSGIGCIGMQGELDSSALTVTGPIFG